MPERELIELIRQLASQSSAPWLKLGVGDDAAVAELPEGQSVVLTTDMVVEGVHFQPGTAPQRVAWKAVARSLSDLAAMATRPLCTLSAVNFGSWRDRARCEALCQSLYRAAQELAAPLVGGDIASAAGPLCVTVTAVGIPGPRGVITRSGAREGDAVCVTSRLGGSLLGRHLSFRPRVPEALALAERFDVHAMIDISDGLSTDALHLAEASGRGILLRLSAVPVSEDAKALARKSGKEPWHHALNDGEDYELLFCLAAKDAQELAQTGLMGLPVSVIGTVLSGPDSQLELPDGRRERLVPGGWEHLR